MLLDLLHVFLEYFHSVCLFASLVGPAEFPLEDLELDISVLLFKQEGCCQCSCQHK